MSRHRNHLRSVASSMHFYGMREAPAISLRDRGSLVVAQQLSVHTIRSELQTLALAALIRNRPSYPSRRRVIVALDIERSTSRPDPVKAEVRTMLYALFDAALRSAGVHTGRRDRFIDRGDGLLALIDRADQALLLNRVVPMFSQLLTSYNVSLPDPGRWQRQLRVRAVMHTGEIHDDDNGCFGEALDIAFRLLGAPRQDRAPSRARPVPARPLRRRLRLGRAPRHRRNRPHGLPPSRHRRGRRQPASGLDPPSPGSRVGEPTRHGDYRRTD